MDLFPPWEDYKNKQLFTNMKKEKTLRCNTKPLKGFNPMVLGAPLNDTYLYNYKLEELEELPLIQSMY